MVRGEYHLRLVQRQIAAPNPPTSQYVDHWHLGFGYRPIAIKPRPLYFHGHVQKIFVMSVLRDSLGNIRSNNAVIDLG